MKSLFTDFTQPSKQRIHDFYFSKKKIKKIIINIIICSTAPKADTLKKKTTMNSSSLLRIQQHVTCTVCDKRKTIKIQQKVCVCAVFGVTLGFDDRPCDCGSESIKHEGLSVHSAQVSPLLLM